MLKAGVAVPATTEWSSPIVFVLKKDGSSQFCVDYRHLNVVTACDSYPLPGMNKYIEFLGKTRKLSTLPDNSADL